MLSSYWPVDFRWPMKSPKQASRRVMTLAAGAAQEEGDPERHGRQGVAPVVDQVGEQGDAAARGVDDRLSSGGRAEQAQADQDRVAGHAAGHGLAVAARQRQRAVEFDGFRRCNLNVLERVERGGGKRDFHRVLVGPHGAAEDTQRYSQQDDAYQSHRAIPLHGSHSFQQLQSSLRTYKRQWNSSAGLRRQAAANSHLRPCAPGLA